MVPWRDGGGVRATCGFQEPRPRVHPQAYQVLCLHGSPRRLGLRGKLRPEQGRDWPGTLWPLLCGLGPLLSPLNVAGHQWLKYISGCPDDRSSLQQDGVTGRPLLGSSEGSVSRGQVGRARASANTPVWQATESPCWDDRSGNGGGFLSSWGKLLETLVGITTQPCSSHSIREGAMAQRGRATRPRPWEGAGLALPATWSGVRSLVLPCPGWVTLGLLALSGSLVPLRPNRDPPGTGHGRT